MGYHRTSLEDIGERLDLTRASLYHYFPSKDALLAECLEYGAEQAFASFRQVLADSADATADERLHALIIAQLRVICRDAPELSRLFVSGMDWPQTFRQQVKSLRDRHDAFFRAIIDEGLRKGEFRCADAEIARHCLHGAMNYAAVWLTARGAAFELAVHNIADSLVLMFHAPR